MKRMYGVVLFAALVLVISSCASEGSNGETEDANGIQKLDIQATNFEYNGGQEEFVVQAGQEVTIEFESAENTHGLAIDEFDIDIQERGKATFTPEKPGEYSIYCSVFCGDGHSSMQTKLIVE